MKRLHFIEMVLLNERSDDNKNDTETPFIVRWRAKYLIVTTASQLRGDLVSVHIALVPLI